MQGISKYILFLGIGVFIGYQFTDSSDRISTNIEAGMSVKSQVARQFEKLIAFQDSKFSSNPVQTTVRPSAVENESKVDLSTYSFHDLTEALDRKIEDFRKQNPIKPKINQEERESLKTAKLTEVFATTMLTSNYWLTTAEFNLRGETAKATIVTNFYLGGEHYGEDIDVKTLATAKSVCWLTTFFMSYKNQKLRTSTSNCESDMDPNEIYYATLDYLSVPKINSFLYYVKVPMPLFQGAELTYLLPDDTNWHKGSSLNWSPISKDEAENMEEHKTFEWAH